MLYLAVAARCLHITGEGSCPVLVPRTPCPGDSVRVVLEFTPLTSTDGRRLCRRYLTYITKTAPSVSTAATDDIVAKNPGVLTQEAVSAAVPSVVTAVGLVVEVETVTSSKGDGCVVLLSMRGLLMFLASPTEWGVTVVTVAGPGEEETTRDAIAGVSDDNHDDIRVATVIGVGVHDDVLFPPPVFELTGKLDVAMGLVGVREDFP